MARIVKHLTAETAYTRIRNTALRDTRVSFKAKGLLACILSHRDGYEINYRVLQRQFGSDGERSILSGLNELEDAGYLSRRRYQDDRGRWVSEWHVTDEPDRSDMPEPNEVPFYKGSEPLPRVSLPGERGQGDGQMSLVDESGDKSVDDPVDTAALADVSQAGKRSADKKTNQEETSQPSVERTGTPVWMELVRDKIVQHGDDKSFDLLEDFLSTWDEMRRDERARGDVGAFIGLTVGYLELVGGEPLDSTTRAMVAKTVRQHGKVALYAWDRAWFATEAHSGQSRMAYARGIINRVLQELKESGTVNR